MGNIWVGFLFLLTSLPSLLEKNPRHDRMRIVERKSIQVTKDSKAETSVIARTKDIKFTFASLMKNGNDNCYYKSNEEFEGTF